MKIIVMSLLLHKKRLGAFSMVDVMVAVAVVALGITALFAANNRSTLMLRSSKQAAVASKCLQQRIEQLRSYNWSEVTDAGSLQSLYATPPLPSVEIPGFAEKVTISAFTPATSTESTAPAPAAPLLVVIRDATGAVSLDSDAPDLVDGIGVRVDVQITWPGPGGDSRKRETSVVIANGGLGR